jgi:hypothetical protein
MTAMERLVLKGRLGWRRATLTSTDDGLRLEAWGVTQNLGQNITAQLTLKRVTVPVSFGALVLLGGLFLTALYDREAGYSVVGFGAIVLTVALSKPSRTLILTGSERTVSLRTADGPVEWMLERINSSRQSQAPATTQPRVSLWQLLTQPPDTLARRVAPEDDRATEIFAAVQRKVRLMAGLPLALGTLCSVLVRLRAAPAPLSEQIIEVSLGAIIYSVLIFVVATPVLAFFQRTFRIGP